MTSNRRHNFSLGEAAIVILILATVTAVAVPKVLGTNRSARADASRRQLQLLRDAIDLYHARTETFPTTGRLIDAIGPMLNGPFPAPSVGTNAGDDRVYYDTTTDTTTSAEPAPGQGGGWVYKPVNGYLRVNTRPNTTGFDW